MVSVSVSVARPPVLQVKTIEERIARLNEREQRNRVKAVQREKQFGGMNAFVSFIFIFFLFLLLLLFVWSCRVSFWGSLHATCDAGYGYGNAYSLYSRWSAC